jgi:AICAR transformylase/IMP cyclohydrolase PurH
MPLSEKQSTLSEVIAAANERQLAMVFTGIRHFRH